MAKSHVVSQLSTKYAHLSGRLAAINKKIEEILAAEQELPDLAKQADELDALLAHIEATVKIFEPSWSPELIKPVRPTVKSNPLGRGELTSRALTILRTTGKPATVRELVDQVVSETDLALLKPEIHKLAARLSNALRKREAQGRIRAEGSPIRWSIPPRPSGS